MSDVHGPSGLSEQHQTGWALLASGQTVQLAQPIERLGARTLDGVIVAVPSGIWAFIQGRDFLSVDESATVTTPGALATDAIGALILAAIGALFLTALVGFVYEVVPTAIWGRTLGKRIIGIKAVNVASGEVPGWRKSLGRWALLILPLAVPYVQIPGVLFFLLCVLTMGHEPFYRGWHDKAAGILVVTSYRDNRRSGRPRPAPAPPRYGLRR